MAMVGLHIIGFVLLQHDNCYYNGRGLPWALATLPQFNQSGRLSNSQDGCQTNSRRYDSFTTGEVRSAILATAGFLVFLSNSFTIRLSRKFAILRFQYTSMETKNQSMMLY